MESQLNKPLPAGNQARKRMTANTKKLLDNSNTNSVPSSCTTSRSHEAHSTPESAEPVTILAQQPNQGFPFNKVAIPRNRAGASFRYSRRVAKACESCRQRKTKCSGDTPVCRQCRELRVTCQYPDGMREKTKR